MSSRDINQLHQAAKRTSKELEAGRRALKERVPREVYQTYEPRYEVLIKQVNDLLATPDAEMSASDRRRHLRAIRRQAFQLEATSVGVSAELGPMGPLIRLITIVFEKLRRRPRQNN